MKSHIENATRADIICSDTDNALIQFGELMEENERKDIEKRVGELRSIINDIRDHGKIRPIEEVNEAVNELQKVCLAAIQAVAVKQQKQQKQEQP